MRILFALPFLFASQAFANDVTVTAEVWADNWFALYVNGALVIEDSVPITTERSFNSETGTFQVSLPAQVAIIAKDYRQNDTGLEYIGTQRQQMGDGGFIAQFRDAATGRVLGVTDSSTVCTVIHRAPLDVSCARERNPQAGSGACAFQSAPEPANWTQAGFNDSAWPAAIEYSEHAVGPKDGYDRIRWDRSASLIWTSSLEQDNTILCRLSLTQ